MKAGDLIRIYNFNVATDVTINLFVFSFAFNFAKIMYYNLYSFIKHLLNKII